MEGKECNKKTRQLYVRYFYDRNIGQIIGCKRLYRKNKHRKIGHFVPSHRNNEHRNIEQFKITYRNNDL